jgi:hypothetical protein
MLLLLRSWRIGFFRAVGGVHRLLLICQRVRARLDGGRWAASRNSADPDRRRAR